jgi:hypothetical protein
VLRRVALALALAAPLPAFAQHGTPEIRARSYDVLTRRLDQYIDQDKVPAIRARLAAERTRIVALPDDRSFMAALNALLFDVAHDKHLSVFLAEPPAPGVAAPAPSYGVGRIERMAGDVAYLELTGFENAPESVAAIDAAMAKVRGAHALVIDLRHNGGGGETSFKRMLGHLFSGRTEITAIEWRECSPPPAEHPDACLPQLPHRLERRYANTPPAPGFPDRPVYVLVGPGSFSAAEALAYELQAHHRATIVGQQTPGGGNPSAGMDLESDFIVIVPIGHMRPVTGTGWEGVGVTPDIKVPADGALDAALAAARRP